MRNFDGNNKIDVGISTFMKKQRNAAQNLVCNHPSKRASLILLIINIKQILTMSTKLCYALIMSYDMVHEDSGSPNFWIVQILLLLPPKQDKFIMKYFK